MYPPRFVTHTITGRPLAEPLPVGRHDYYGIPKRQCKLCHRTPDRGPPAV